MGGCDDVQSTAEGNYPMSEVRGRSWEDPMPKGWWPRGATPCPRSGAAAERSYLMSEVRAAVERSYPASEVKGGSQEELCHVRGQGWRLRVPGCDSTGATKRSYPRPRPGAVARRSCPMPEEQWLRFDGAAMKRYPMSKVRETQVRW